MTINSGVTVAQSGSYSSMIENGYQSYNSGNARTGYVSGTNAENPTLTINGGTFTGGLNTVKNDDGGCLYINGGTYSNTTQAAILNWNVATITDGTFNSSAAVVLNAYGDASVDRGELIISGGTFTAGTNSSVFGGMGNSYGIGTVTVSGGTFNAGSGQSVFNTSSTNQSGTITVSGGTYNSDVSEYVVAGNTAIETSTDSGIYIIGTDTSADSEAVAEVNGYGYTTLQAAIAAAGDGDTVTLLKGTTEDITIASNQKITLDLNGNKIINSSSHTITNYGTLTVTDSSTAQTGTVDNVTHGKGALVNYGTAYLNGGTFTRSAEAGTSSSDNGGNSWYTVKNYNQMTVNGATIENSGKYSSCFANGYQNTNDKTNAQAITGDVTPTLTINSGTVSGGINSVKNDDYAVLTINGGTFKSYDQCALQNHSTVTINGGDFTGGKYVLYNCGCDGTADVGVMTINGGTFKADENTAFVLAMVSTADTASVIITGGTFDAGSSASVFGASTGATEIENSKIAVSGGSFSAIVPAAYCAADYVPVTTKDAEGMYTVVTSNLESESTNSNIEVALGETSYTYDGTEKKPAVTVTFYGATLTEGTDYTVTYSDNTNAGIATVTVEGFGSYSGTVTKEFSISPAAIPSVVISTVASKTYDGEAVEAPVVTVDLPAGEVYTTTVTYYNASDLANPLDAAPSAVGSYKVVVTVKSANYETVTKEATFTIDENSQTVKITTANATYDGKAHEVTVEAGEGSTVTVTYTDESGNTVQAPVDAGTYTAAVTVTRTGYKTVSETVTVTISKAAQSISYAAASVSKTEGDAAFTNALTAASLFGTVTYSSSNTAVATVDANGQVTIVGPGTATITATAAGSDSYTAASASYTLTVAAKEAGETEPTASPDSGTTTVTITPAPTATATSPSTGDESSVLLWAVLLVCAACGLGVTAVVSGKKQKNQ
ncbi:MAG: MBG domain-containing protein [Oscillospiraceae bacterium]|nr:MBG domain-containing protein [Oscillospiraceae bacterium]